MPKPCHEHTELALRYVFWNLAQRNFETCTLQSAARTKVEGRERRPPLQLHHEASAASRIEAGSFHVRVHFRAHTPQQRQVRHGETIERRSEWIVRPTTQHQTRAARGREKRAQHRLQNERRATAGFSHSVLNDE